ncbi:MAG: glycosyltransferase family 4 protein [Deltaproteobacteria bacterium]|nr:glycosyltransferase family 4 protein [Deltaproteobacteria bacterium]
MKKLSFVTSTFMTCDIFLKDYISALAGVAEVHVFTNIENAALIDDRFPAKIISIPIRRKIDPVRDLTCLIKLYHSLRSIKPRSSHSVTPKAGFLSMVASYFAGVPYRIHTFTGQIWANKKGLKRAILKSCDRILSAFATHLFADSHSQREFLIKEKIVKPDKISVLGFGSISGVDTRRFKPNPDIRREWRKRLNVGSEDTVFLFLGRLTKDKGIYDLIDAFSTIVNTYSDAHLLIVGPDEENLLPDITKRVYSFKDRVQFIGYTNSPEVFMNAADVLCLPSYREGFGVVIIEAASVGIPAIGSRIYGITDAIVENETGLLFEAGNVKELAQCMEIMLKNKEKRINMGVSARKRAINHFSKEFMVKEFLNFYEKILAH